MINLEQINTPPEKLREQAEAKLARENGSRERASLVQSGLCLGLPQQRWSGVEASIKSCGNPVFPYAIGWICGECVV
jgi:hypothetical protein